MAKGPTHKATASSAGDTLTALAYKRLKDDIVRNKFKPGECLSSPQLARNMHMSRTPVREALGRLANEGFVDIQNGVGIFIKALTREQLAEIHEVRLALECAALEAFIDQSGPEALGKSPALEKLERDWAALKARLKAGRIPGLDEVMDLDYKTHDFIVEKSGNSFLMELVENIRLKIRHIQYMSVFALNDLEDTIDQHLGIVASIRRGDIEESRRLFRLHIREAISYIFHEPGHHQADMESPPKRKRPGGP